MASEQEALFDEAPAESDKPKFQKVAMPAITIWQPWSLLLAKKVKRFETRHWAPNEGLIGKRWAIHAAARVPRPVDCAPMERLAIEKALGMPAEHFSTLPRGAVVATGLLKGAYRVTRFLERENRVEIGVRLPGSDKMVREFTFGPGEVMFGDYRPGRWLWHFDEIDELKKPIITKGAQGIWTWRGELPVND